MTSATAASQITRVRGPAFESKLSSFDCRHSAFFSRRILVFRTAASPENLSDVITRATTLLVQKFPFLAGQAVLSKSSAPTGQSNWKDIVPGPGVSISTRDLRSEVSYAALQKSDFAPLSLKHDDLIPIPLKIGPEPYDITHFRLNFIEGGLLLAVCIAHIAGDGVGQSEMLRVFASYCKLVSGSTENQQTGEPIGLDRSSLVGLKSPLSSIEHHPAMIQKHPSMSLQIESDLPTEEIRIYRMDTKKLAQLKRDATSADKRISTNDALMALVWRAVVTSRIAAGVLDPSQETTLYFPVSLRRTLSLGDDYVGNAVCNRIVKQPVARLIGDLKDSLQETAYLIRQEINKVTGDLARGYAQLSDSSPSVTDFMFGGFATNKSTSLAISSLYHSNQPLMDAEWGSLLGDRLWRLRCSDVGYAGILGGTNFILPSPSGQPDQSTIQEDKDRSTVGQGRGAEVQVSVYPTAVKALEGDLGWRLYCTDFA